MSKKWVTRFDCYLNYFIELLLYHQLDKAYFSQPVRCDLRHTAHDQLL